MMTIGAFSERTGLRPKTLRYYEEVGLLGPKVRLANGYRQYEDGQVETALLIHSLRQADVGIADIRRFLEGDRTGQEQLLQRWREEAEAKLLSLQIAKQFLHGFNPRATHLRLVRWEEPKRIAWFPLLGEDALRPDRWFDPNNGYLGRLIPDGSAAKLRTCYVRYTETESRFNGEIGYEIADEWIKDMGRDNAAPITEHPRTLFVAVECNPDQAAPCKPVFASILKSGFEPVGTPLRQYSAGASDRYTLLVPVMLQPNR